MRSADATRARILDAAHEEFARRGIAGARVDRIAELARANKAQLYAYYGSKDGLFDAVFERALEAIVNAVPVDAENLGEYAVRLYDEYLRHPELVRLAVWNRLERRPIGHLTAEPLPRQDAKLAEIARAQAEGLVDASMDPFDVFATVIALSMTWSPVSSLFTASEDDTASEHERRRGVLRTVIERAFAPSS